jgi:DNA-directed RNA polymerase subunit RPC12/RpoP
MSKKKRRKSPIKASLKGVSKVKYVCSNCGTEEDIPTDVLEYFDHANPQQLIFGEHEFTCEKCGFGVMKPVDKRETVVRGFGLFGDIQIP